MLSLLGLECGRRAPVADVLLPRELGGCKRSEMHELPSESVPAESGGVNLRRAFQATYKAPAAVQVKILELASPAAALDLAQRWRQEADSVSFYQGNYFAVVKWESFDRQKLAAFVRALQQHLRVLESSQPAPR